MHEKLVYQISGYK